MASFEVTKVDTGPVECYRERLTQLHTQLLETLQGEDSLRRFSFLDPGDLDQADLDQVGLDQVGLDQEDSYSVFLENEREIKQASTLAAFQAQLTHRHQLIVAVTETLFSSPCSLSASNCSQSSSSQSSSSQSNLSTADSAVAKIFCIEAMIYPLLQQLKDSNQQLMAQMRQEQHSLCIELSNFQKQKKARQGYSNISNCF